MTFSKLQSYLALQGFTLQDYDQETTTLIFNRQWMFIGKISREDDKIIYCDYFDIMKGGTSYNVDIPIFVELLIKDAEVIIETK